MQIKKKCCRADLKIRCAVTAYSQYVKLHRYFFPALPYSTYKTRFIRAVSKREKMNKVKDRSIIP